MQRTKITCELCGQEISKSNYSKHLRRHEVHPETFRESYHLDHDDLFCKYCGKGYKSKNSLVQHEIRCRYNPDKINTTIEGFNNFGRPSWTKGLTKFTDERIAKSASTYNKNKLLGLHNTPHKPYSDEFKEKQRQNALKRGLGGFNMRRGVDYNGIKLDSSYEVEVAKNLDRNGVSWARCSRFPYVVNGKLHYYTPDFYLPEYDVYLDPKNDFLIENVNPSTGYKDIDKIKWVEEQNNIKVIILSKDELSWESIKNKLLL